MQPDSENCLSVNCPPLRCEPGMMNIPLSHRVSDDSHLHTVEEEGEVSPALDTGMAQLAVTTVPFFNALMNITVAWFAGLKAIT